MTTLRKAYEEFLLVGQANGLSPETIKWYRWTLKPFLKATGESVAIQSMTRHDMRVYVAGLRERNQRFVDAPQRKPQEGGLSESSLKAYITSLQSFWNFCSTEYGIDNPMEGIKRPNPKPAPKAISTASFNKIFNATEFSKCGERDRLVLCLLADTGARRSGLLHLNIEDMDMRNRRALVEEKRGTRFIYWTQYTQLVIDQWLAIHPTGVGRLLVNVNTGEPLTGSGLYQITRRLKKIAGVTGRVNPHSFRHNFARMYLMNGGDVVTLARLLGHRDINLTASFYAVFSSNELAKLQELHSPLLQMLGVA